MSFDYSAESRRLQDHYDTRRLADRLADVKVHERFTASDREFIEERDIFFLATVDERGHPTCSYKGGDPGFVTVVDDTARNVSTWMRHSRREFTAQPRSGSPLVWG